MTTQREGQPTPDPRVAGDWRTLAGQRGPEGRRSSPEKVKPKAKNK